MTFDEWFASLEADEPGQHSEQDCVRGVNIKGLLRVCWNAATERCAGIVREKAETQGHYASAQYTQHSDADRETFRHAEKMLRLVATAIEKGTT